MALCELMQSGVTTVCDLSAPREDWLDTLGASGLRVYAMPMFRSGRWYTPNGHEVRYAWDEKAGRDGLDRALRLIDRARQHPSGRLDGALYPAQVDITAIAMGLRRFVPGDEPGGVANNLPRRGRFDRIRHNIPSKQSWLYSTIPEPRHSTLNDFSC